MRLSLKAKLIGAFLLVALLVVVAGGVGMTMSAIIGKAGDVVAKRMSPVQTAAMKGAMALGQLRTAVDNYLVAKSGLESQEAAMDQLLADYEMWVKMPIYGTASADFKDSAVGKNYQKLGLSLVVERGPEAIVTIAQKQEAMIKSLAAVVGKAKEVQRAFVKDFVVVVDGNAIELAEFVPKAKLDFINWSDTLGDAGSIGTRFPLTTEPDKTLLGKWLYKVSSEDPDLIKLVDGLKKYHEKYIKMAVDINAAKTIEEKGAIFVKSKTPKVKINNGFVKLDAYVRQKVDEAQVVRQESKDKILKLGQELAQLSDQLTQEVDKEMSTAVAGAGKAKASANVILPIITIIALIFSIFIGFLISGVITRGVFDVSSVMTKVAGGDLRNKVKVSSNDEIGDLAKNVNGMVTGLSDLIAKVKNSAKQLTAATQEISASSQQISDGAQQQSASFEELSSSVQANADSAKQASQVSKEAVGEAQATRQAMDGTIDAMTSIEKSSKQMAEAVSLISEIADQTNLLALNAAIEAARAGEHGKGFAVVADEVRQLAERSATSAKEIEGLIKTSLKEIESGVEVSKRAGENTKKVIEKINHMADQFMKIAEATQEQAAAMEQNTSITESNAASAEELATTSEEMAAQAGLLAELVSQFQVDEALAAAQEQSGARASGPAVAPRHSLRNQPAARKEHTPAIKTPVSSGARPASHKEKGEDEKLRIG